MDKTNFNRIVFLLTLTITIILSGCGTSTYTESGLPVIKVDENHDFVNEHVFEKTPVVTQYEVPAEDGFILDVSRYKIKIPPQAIGVTTPNRIEVSVRFYDGIYKSTVYYVNWQNNVESFELSSRTLIPLGHTKPFTSLQAGQEIGVAIVFFDKNGQVTGKEITYPLWGALVNVK